MFYWDGIALKESFCQNLHQTFSSNVYSVFILLYFMKMVGLNVLLRLCLQSPTDYQVTIIKVGMAMTLTLSLLAATVFAIATRAYYNQQS